jgi:hypothetical protein
MRRPVTAWLLVTFLALQLYWAHGAMSRTATGPGFERVTVAPAGLVAVRGQTYLVGEQGAWTLTTRAGHVMLTSVAARWVDVPEPSGHGVWRVLATSAGVPLVGLGGPVLPNPATPLTLWVDAGTHQAYLSQGIGSLTPIAGLTVTRARWSADGAVAVFYGDGPEGLGIYEWSLATGLAFVMTTGSVPVDNLGVTAGHAVVAALGDGTVWIEGVGHPILKARPAFVSPAGTVLGFLRDGRAVWWTNSQRLPVAVPAWPVDLPRFGSGLTAAYIAQVGRSRKLVEIIGDRSYVENLPGQPAHLVGFVGQEPVVTVLSGRTIQGTYVLPAPGPSTPPSAPHAHSTHRKRPSTS